MRIIRRFISALLLLLLLSNCAQQVAPSYSDELGPNGLPTARALFSRYVEAIGGEAVIRSHRSTHSSGRFLLAAFGIEGSVESYGAAPNHISQIIELRSL